MAYWLVALVQKYSWRDVVKFRVMVRVTSELQVRIKLGLQPG